MFNFNSIYFQLVASLLLGSHACAFESAPADLIESERNENQPTKISDPCRHIICISIPKSGTHLFHKCLVLFDLKDVYHSEKKGLSQEFIAMIKRLNTKSPPNHYRGIFHIPTAGPIPKHTIRQMENSATARSFTIHWPYTKESEEIFTSYGKANFFMIRDPRDQLVSMAFMVYKNSNGQEVSFDEALIDLIDGRQRLYIPWAVEIQATHPVMWELGVVDFYKIYMPWMKSEKFYTVKFENLIGANGGGSAERQTQEIQNIACHLGLELPSERVNEITEKLFGDTFTFREGKIGSWKRYFTPKTKEIFKSTPGACQLLIDLGYEENDEW